MSLTRGQIITEGLAQANRPDLVSSARLWLNIFLEECYRNQDFNWLKKYVYGRALVEGDTLPDDYRAMDVINVGPQRLPLRIVDSDEFEWMRRGVNFSQLTSNQYGTPVVAHIDEAEEVVHFWPLPPTGSLATTYNYFYYFMPALPDPTNPSNDSLYPEWGQLSPDVLVQFVYARALRYQDDLRAKDEMDKVKVMLNESKMNSRDMRAGSPRMKLGKSHVRRRF